MTRSTGKNPSIGKRTVSLGNWGPQRRSTVVFFPRSPRCLDINPAGILRDYMPDSKSNWKRYSPDCMATCRGWQKCPLRFVSKGDVEIPCKAGDSAGRQGILRCAQNDRVMRAILDCEVVTESSEIPCRVSSDLHEWRNESATVLPTDTANL